MSDFLTSNTNIIVLNEDEVFHIDGIKITRLDVSECDFTDFQVNTRLVIQALKTFFRSEDNPETEDPSNNVRTIFCGEFRASVHNCLVWGKVRREDDVAYLPFIGIQTLEQI